MVVKEFVSKYRPYAEETERKTGISAVFILAQAALETGWGSSAPGNMFFGVKAKESTPAHQKQLLLTSEVLGYDLATYKANKTIRKFPEVVKVTPYGKGKYLYRVRDWFRKYESAEESFTDHAQLFLRAKRYAKALAVKSDPYRFAEEVARAGYATDPKYAEKLKKVVDLIVNV